MKKPNMLITKINHAEQSVEWEILRETYKQSNSIEIIDEYCKNHIGDFYVLAKPSIAENLKTYRIFDTLESKRYSIRDSMENWGENKNIEYIVSLLSSYKSRENNWSISLVRHKNRLYLFHIIKLNINPTRWFDKNGEPHTSDLADICIVYGRSISSLNYVKQITNLNKISEMMERGSYLKSINNEKFYCFSLNISMKDIEISKSALRNNVDTLFGTDSYTQIGFLSFNKCGRLEKINMCKCWYRRLIRYLNGSIRYLKDKISQLK